MSRSASIAAGLRTISTRYIGRRTLQDRLQRATLADSGYLTLTSTLKFARTFFDGHNLATGWEVSKRQSDEHVMRRDRLSGAEETMVDERFEPEVRRLAAFAQDEWSVTKQWSLYLGARWEKIATDSSGTGIPSSSSRSQVLSPVAQSLYKFPDKSGRQVRVALTRTYKAPEPGQLSARRYIASLNTRFSPDSIGNPALKPELASGIDLTYEHFWAPSALFSVAFGARRITDYIRSQRDQDDNGQWFDQPVNSGRAHVRTLDVEAKFPLKAVWTAAASVDVRASEP
ncbi:TonB-dependent receptor [Massilia sp. H-1]|nr:TonB-dependent receptor [Massilia sp. H-1]